MCQRSLDSLVREGVRHERQEFSEFARGDKRAVQLGPKRCIAVTITVSFGNRNSGERRESLAAGSRRPFSDRQNLRDRLYRLRRLR